MQTRSLWLRSLALAAALFLLNASLTFVNTWPTPGVRWRGALSIELAVFVLILAAATSWFGPLSRAALRRLAVLWVVLALSHYAEVTAQALYGREINLYWDLRFMPAVAALLTRPERLWIVVLAAVAALLVLFLLYAILRWALGRVGDAMTRPLERAVLGVAAAALVVMFVGQQINDIVLDHTPVFLPPVTETYARQVRLAVASLRSSHSLAASPSMDSDLSLVKGADVFVVFIESYGAVSYENPAFAERLAADRVQLSAAIADTHREVVSAFVESPTFGGSSWLAHITLLSGVDVRDHDTNALLMTQKRDTLLTTFKRQGYRTVAMMPGMWQDWPEGVFYGFDVLYGGAKLDYRGPEFGWWDMTDQFALAKMDALEVDRTPRPPLFVFFPTISTHIPFTPTPPYQADWTRMLTAHPYDAADVNRAYLSQPDWTDLGPGYTTALSYTYKSLAGYLRVQPTRDFVMVLLGDHQPAAVVSGEGAPWDVPVHIITSRRAVLDRLLAHGFRPGLAPARPSLGHMNTLLPVLLESFGNREK